jgi:hypothetical protein
MLQAFDVIAFRRSGSDRSIEEIAQVAVGFASFHMVIGDHQDGMGYGDEGAFLAPGWELYQPRVSPAVPTTSPGDRQP